MDFRWTVPTGAFESMVADIVGVKHALATANGTAAIHLVYLGLGLSAGMKWWFPVLPIKRHPMSRF